MFKRKIQFFILLTFTASLVTGCGKLWGTVSYQSAAPPNAIVQFQLGQAGFGTEGIALARDAHQNTFIAGWTTGVIGTQYGSHGNIDALVYAYNALGNPLWATQIGPGAGGNAVTTATCLDSAGNIYVQGTVNGNLGGTQVGVTGASDMFIAKFNPSGLLLWVTQMNQGGTTIGVTSGLIIDNSGNLVASGSTTASLGGAQYGVHGPKDLFIAKFDTSGNFLWVSQLGANLDTLVPGGFAQSSSSGIFYVAGYGNGVIAGATQYGVHGSQDLVLTQFNSAGVYLQTSQLGGTVSTTNAFGVVVANGSVYVSGGTHSNLGGIQYGTHGNTDLFLANFNSGGALQWVNQLGQTLTFTYATTLSADGSGNLMAVGYTGGLLGTLFGTRNAGDLDGLFVKFDPNGNLLWADQIGQAGQNTNGYFGLWSPTGLFTFTGWTSGVLTGNQYGTHATGNQNAFITTVDQNGVLQ